MPRLTTGGPELPLGRSARSTRKTKPSSVVSPISVYSRLATCEKYSCAEVSPAPLGRPDAVGLAVVLVDVDQVDVGRHVELARAELAHADDPEVDAARWRRAARRGARRRRPGCGQGELQRGLGQRRHGAGDRGPAARPARRPAPPAAPAPAGAPRARPTAARGPRLQLHQRRDRGGVGHPAASNGRSAAKRRRTRCTNRLWSACAATASGMECPLLDRTEAPARVVSRVRAVGRGDSAAQGSRPSARGVKASESTA
jgi:hypothetical protein